MPKISNDTENMSSKLFLHVSDLTTIPIDHENIFVSFSSDIFLKSICDIIFCSCCQYEVDTHVVTHYITDSYIIFLLVCLSVQLFLGNYWTDPAEILLI